jgi:hypothetical protein
MVAAAPYINKERLLSAIFCYTREREKEKKNTLLPVQSHPLAFFFSVNLNGRKFIFSLFKRKENRL